VNNIKNIAIILASGQGSRFGTKMPKQFVPLAGKPVLQYTIEAFENAKNIDEIIIATKEEYIAFVNEIVSSQGYKKVRQVIAGGRQRFESSYLALLSIKEEEAKLLIHDAVRPFISEKIIDNYIKALDVYRAVDVVVDAVDTIVRVKDDLIQEIPDRKFFKRSQTPQAFKKSLLREAFELFFKDADGEASDDCGIVAKYLPSEKIGIVQGEERNFKITRIEDIYLAESLIKAGDGE